MWGLRSAKDEETVDDFGKQWTEFRDSTGFFGSVELLADFVRPFDLELIRGKKVADIGAGMGRFTRALLEAGASEVVAVEPSEAADVIPETLVGTDPSKVRILRLRGDEVPADLGLDVAVSIGVLHHVPQPSGTIQAVHRALKPGGYFVAWLYGKEGNGLLLALVGPLRMLTRRSPHSVVRGLSIALDVPLVIYMFLCRHLPSLPLATYLNGILGRLPKDKRRLVIYDQLHPRYAKYYSREEALRLMGSAPFDVCIHERRGFSWVVIGRKKEEPSGPDLSRDGTL